MLEASTTDYLIVIVFGVTAVIQAHRIADLTARCNDYRSLISQTYHNWLKNWIKWFYRNSELEII